MTLPFPVPAEEGSTVLVPAPGTGRGNWAGAPSAAVDPHGGFLIAYRVRTPDQRGSRVMVAKVDDAFRLSTMCVLDKEMFGAESLERPALVPIATGWRLYVSCATPNSKHWRIDGVDARDPSGFGDARPRTVFAGSTAVGVKDPVVRRIGDRWEAWVCCHPLDIPGEEDRMTTAYATSADGLTWQWQGKVLSGRPGKWDARGARVTSVLRDGRGSYDGRATKAENFAERTGLAVPGAGAALTAVDGDPVSSTRYLDVIETRDAYVLFFEQPRAGGSHDLCVERVPIR